MERSKLIIVSVPDKEKHYIIRSSDTEDLILIGNVCIYGTIQGICNSYDESLIVYNNINR